MNVQSKSFETLLEEAVDGPGLALEIKKAEMATSDLATLVRVSELKSRDMLAASLGDFVEDARKAGRGLTRFSSKVGGAVDKSVHYFILSSSEGYSHSDRFMEIIILVSSRSTTMHFTQ